MDIALLGEDALRKLELNEYDLAILDLNLPDIDGLKLCQTIRAQRAKLLILILTCRVGLKDRVMGLGIGLMIIWPGLFTSRSFLRGSGLS